VLVICELEITHCLLKVRTRLATDIGRGQSREFKGPIDCLVKILKSDGPIGLYRGFTVSVQAIFLYRGAYFGLFDTAKLLLVKDDERLNFLYTWGIAQVVTTAAGVIVYPFDTVRRRLMMQSGRTDSLYKGVLDCARTIIVQEGPSALFKGALTNVFRGTGGALVLAIYEEIHKCL